MFIAVGYRGASYSEGVGLMKHVLMANPKGKTLNPKSCTFARREHHARRCLCEKSMLFMALGYRGAWFSEEVGVIKHVLMANPKCKTLKPQP